MKRREFLKGLGLLLAAPVVAKIPMALPKKEAAFAPTGFTWVRYDGRAIIDSHNVSGINQTDVGRYTINFDKPVNDYFVNAQRVTKLGRTF